jgi:predicted DNA-binding transcriptional regulator YafY
MSIAKIVATITLASWKSVVLFDYVNNKGEKSQKRIEVMDLDNTFFFGFDLEANKTKTFKYESIANLVVVGTFDAAARKASFIK